MPDVAWSYLRVPAQSLRSCRWRLQLGAHALQAWPERLDGWEPTQDITVTVQFQAERARILHDCGLGEEDCVGAVLVWASEGTNLRGAGKVIPLVKEGDWGSSILTCVIHGLALAESVDVGLQIVLLRSPVNKNALTADVPGMVLAEDRRRMIIEGGAEQFPVSAADFENCGWGRGAGWKLLCRPDMLEEPLGRSFRLFVNKRNKRTIEAVGRAGEEPSDILDLMMHDVALTMISAALSVGEFVERPEEFEAHTLGGTIARLIGQLIPDKPIPELRDIRARDPGKLSALIQHALRVPGDGDSK